MATTKYAQAARLLGGGARKGARAREQAAFYRYDQSFDPPGGAPASHAPRISRMVRVVPSKIGGPSHERTLVPRAQEDRLNLRAKRATNLSPGFMLYRDPKARPHGALRHGEVRRKIHDADAVEDIAIAR